MLTRRSLVRGILCVLTVTLSFVAGQGDRKLKPEDLFLQGHLLMQESRRLEDAVDYERAAAKCREASEIYDLIASGNPTWNSTMVDSRRKKVRREYERLQQMAIDQHGSGLELPQRASDGPGIAVAPRGLPGGIAPLPRAATPRQKQQQLEREVEDLRAMRAKLLQQSVEQQDHTMAANRALGAERQRVNELQQELAAAQEELKRMDGVGVIAMKNQVEDLTRQLEEATKALAETNKQYGDVLAEFKKGQQEIESLSLQVEELTQQRDEMMAVIKGMQTGESSLQLVTENTRLREQLNAAQARVDELEFDKIESDAEIASLREEVSQLRTELAVLRKENEEYKQRLIDTRSMLTETEQEATFNPPSIENEAARKENEILRGVISRYLKQQQFLQEKREIVLAELEGLDAGSDQLNEQIRALTAEVPMTPEEEAAYKREASTEATLATAQLSGSAPQVGNDSVDRKIARSAEAAAYNYENERYEEAELHYEDILTFAPQHVETLCNLGVTKIRLNEVKEARRLFEKSILLEPENARAQFMLSVACYHLADEANALVAISEAQRIDPSNSEYPSFLGLLYLKQGSVEKAIVALQSAVNLDSRDAIAHYNLCIALRSQAAPDLARAFRHYEEAKKLGLSPDSKVEESFRKRGFGAAPASS